MNSYRTPPPSPPHPRHLPPFRHWLWTNPNKILIRHEIRPWIALWNVWGSERCTRWINGLADPINYLKKSSLKYTPSENHQNKFTVIYSHHHHHHLSLNREGRWGTTDDFATSFLHFSLFSTALWDMANSRAVHSLMLSSHLFLCLPCLLPPFTVPCRMFLARPDGRETWPYYCSLRLFTVVRRSSCGPITCWILARTSSLVTWSL